MPYGAELEVERSGRHGGEVAPIVEGWRDRGCQGLCKEDCALIWRRLCINAALAIYRAGSGGPYPRRPLQSATMINVSSRTT